MGELCLILLIVGFIWNKYHDCKDAIRTGEDWKKAKQEDRKYFYNCGTGSVFRTTDGHPVFPYQDPYSGDFMEKDYKTGMIANLSQEKRESEYQKAKESGFPSAVKWTNCNETNLINPYVKSFECRKDVYKDVKTGRLMLVQYYGFMYFFRDIETFELIRPTDQHILIETYAKNNGYNYYGKKYYDAMINWFNKQQNDQAKRHKCDKNGYSRIYDADHIEKEWFWYDSERYLNKEDIVESVIRRPKIGMEARYYGPLKQDGWVKDGTIYRSFNLGIMETSSDYMIRLFNKEKKLVKIGGYWWEELAKEL